MNKKLNDILNQLTKAHLMDIIRDLYLEKEIKPLLEQQIASFDPKALEKLLNKNITSIKRSKRFIDYYEVADFVKKLDQVNDGIEKLLDLNAPQVALNVCKKMIDLEAHIFSRADDSSGELGDCYYRTYALLDRSICGSDVDSEQMADYLLNIYLNDDYGVRSYLFDRCKHCLKQGIDIPLERKVMALKKIENYQRQDILKAIADARNDVDGYIKVVKEHSQKTGQTISQKERCLVAKRLNDAFRGDEAIQWLEKQDDEHEHQYHERTELLIEAYRLEGLEHKAQETLWQRFEQNLNVNDYLRYLKYANKDKQQWAQSQIFTLCQNHQDISEVIDFFYQTQSFDWLDQYIFNHIDQLNKRHYSLLRKVSTALSLHGKNLSATLIRRKLILDVLEKAQSKYYKYAVSDLKKANDFAQLISDWKAFDDHQKFLQSLKETHKRKNAFWHQVVSS